MRTTLTAVAVIAVLSVAGCGTGPSDEAGAPPATTSSAPLDDPTARDDEPQAPVADATAETISVQQTAGRGSGTVWALDAQRDASRPGAGRAFDAAVDPAVVDAAGRGRPEVESARGSEDAYRLTIVYADGRRVVVEGAESGLPGPLLDVVESVRKSAEPVTG